MPSKWTIGQEAGTGTWAVFKNDVKHGRSHANDKEAERARANFELEERRLEAEAAKKKQGAKK